MKSWLKNTAIFSALLLTLVYSMAPASAQESSAPPAATSSGKIAANAKAIISKYLAAMGGEEKLAKVKTLSMQGVVAIPAAGINGEMSMLLGEHGKFHMRVDLPGVATQESGSDGKTVWESSSVTGTEVLNGTRLEQLKFQMTPFPTLTMEQAFDSIETAGVEEWGGEKCNVVIAKKKGLPPMKTYYSIETGLEMGNRMTAATAMGDIDLKSVVKSYIEKDGMQYPEVVETIFPNGMVQAITVKQIEFNAKIDPARFALPKEVAQKK